MDHLIVMLELQPITRWYLILCMPQDGVEISIYL
jgi:hypothetical protein